MDIGDHRFLAGETTLHRFYNSPRTAGDLYAELLPYNLHCHILQRKLSRPAISSK